MDRKLSQTFVEPQYTYAEIERALAGVLRVSAQTQVGALRGRLKHYQRLGLPGIEAGKGARVRYSQEQAAQWLLALLLAQIGIDPTIIVRAVKSNWRSLLASGIRNATNLEAYSNPYMLALRPQLMTDTWRDKDPGLTLELFRLQSTVPRPMDRLDELSHRLDKDRRLWLCVIDISIPLGALITALPLKG